MYTRQTVLMFAGLVLVGLNALVAGHWLNVKSAVTDAAAAGAPTLNLKLPSAGQIAGKGAAGVVKGQYDALGPLAPVIDPLAPAAGYALTPGNIGKIKKKLARLVP